jgi:hypothetical protein
MAIAPHLGLSQRLFSGILCKFVSCIINCVNSRVKSPVLLLESGENGEGREGLHRGEKVRSCCTGKLNFLMYLAGKQNSKKKVLKW